MIKLDINKPNPPHLSRLIIKHNNQTLVQATSLCYAVAGAQYHHLSPSRHYNTTSLFFWPLSAVTPEGETAAVAAFYYKRQPQPITIEPPGVILLHQRLNSRTTAMSPPTITSITSGETGTCATVVFCIVVLFVSITMTFRYVLCSLTFENGSTRFSFRVFIYGFTVWFRLTFWLRLSWCECDRRCLC